MRRAVLRPGLKLRYPVIKAIRHATKHRTISCMNKIIIEQFDRNTFVNRYGGLYEHSPWIAEAAWEKIKDQTSITVDSLRSQLKIIVDSASEEQQLALLCAHPELAGIAAINGELTAESTDEQASARLDLCSDAEYEKFQNLNKQYNNRFSFPFILAVRGRSRVEILEAFESRLHNTVDQEFYTAIEQVHQIASMRLDVIEAG